MTKLPQFSAPNAPFVGPDGRLTYAANVFLRDLWLRTGGADASTNTEIESMIDGAFLGVFSPRAAPQAPADIGFVRSFTQSPQSPQEPASISYIEAFAHRPAQQSAPLGDASALICSRVFRHR